MQKTSVLMNSTFNVRISNCVGFCIPIIRYALIFFFPFSLITNISFLTSEDVCLSCLLISLFILLMLKLKVNLDLHTITEFFDQELILFEFRRRVLILPSNTLIHFINVEVKGKFRLAYHN